MSDHKAAIKAEKKSHAQEIINALDAVAVVLNSNPDLWFGGLPQNLAQLDAFITMQKTNIKTALELEESVSTPAPVV